jgi:hypothetical protein
MSYLMKLPLAIRSRVSRKWVALFFGLWAMVTPAFAQYNEPLYCQPNEGNTFTIKSGGTFSIDSDCGTSTIVTNPTHGTLTLSGYQTWVYTATNGYLGSDIFTVHVSTSVGSPGGQGNFNEGGGNETITLNITQSAPATASVTATTPYNTVKTIDLTSSITGNSITSVNLYGAPSHGTATLSGDVLTYTPTSTFYGGTDQFYYTATNSGGTSSPALVTITVGAPPVPTASALTTNTAYNTAKAISLSGSITGVDITGIAIATAPTHGTAVVSGQTVTYTPSSTFYGGLDSFTYTAINPGGASAPATVQITVAPSPSPTAVVAVATTALSAKQPATTFTPVTGSGGIGALTYSVSSLPAGLSLAPATGVISGSPTSASPQGNYTVTVTDIAAHTATAAFTLTINPVVTATQAQASAALTEALATSPFTPVTATGGTGTLTYSIHPSLPIGLSFASASGSITGTASVPLAATTYTVTATDTNGATASANFLLTVNPPVLATVVVAEKTLTQNQPATPFQPVAATGGTGALHYSVTPALPSGLSISSTSGVVSGTPAAANASTTYTITATDTNGAAKSATFSLSISGAVVASQTIASKALTLNQVAPSFTPVVATGGTGALTYAVTPALPTGLSLSASTGAISGTPTVAIPAMTYTVTATDSNGASSSAPFSLNVQSVPALPSPP